MTLPAPRAAIVVLAAFLVACPKSKTKDGEPGNRAPVADAGPERTVQMGVAAQLSGAASWDPDGDSLSYAWALEVKPQGSAAGLISVAGVQTALVPDLAGSYVVSLLVTDSRGATSRALTVVTAAGGGGGGNPPPVANAGPDRTVPFHVAVQLDGSASFDPGQEAIALSWRISSAPVGSAAALSQAQTAHPSFTPDLVGAYTVELTVADPGARTATDLVVITAVNPPPVADAGPDRAVTVGDNVVLDGSASADPDGEPIAFAWTLESKPTGSAAALSGPATAAPSLVADVAGTYLVSLTVNNSSGTGGPVTARIVAYLPLAPLVHRVLDAEYAKALDRIVMVDEAPSALYVYDPEARTETRVFLPLPPTAVSVAPDGQHAVVGHDGYVSHVDLATPKVLQTWPVAARLGDVVAAGNGFAYLFPLTPSFDTIHALDLASGAETAGSGFLGFEGTRAKLHPGGTAIYGADNGVSPADIRKFDISGGATVTGYDSPYHGDYAMCGDLWLSEDGARIFTRCGNVFRSSSTRSVDMTYNGALEATGAVVHLSHSQLAGRILAIPAAPFFGGTGTEDTFVRVFEDSFLTQEPAVPLSPFAVAGKSYAGHGRFVFFKADGTRRYALVQADPASAMLHDFAVMAF